MYGSLKNILILKDAAPETKHYKLPDGKEIVLGAPKKETTEFFISTALLQSLNK